MEVQWSVKRSMPGRGIELASDTSRHYQPHAFRRTASGPGTADFTTVESTYNETGYNEKPALTAFLKIPEFYFEL